MNPEDEAKRQQMQREVASTLFDRYTRVATGTREDARAMFIETVAPWVFSSGMISALEDDACAEQAQIIAEIRSDLDRALVMLEPLIAKMKKARDA